MTACRILKGGMGRPVFSAKDEETGLPMGCPSMWVVR